MKKYLLIALSLLTIIYSSLYIMDNRPLALEENLIRAYLDNKIDMNNDGKISKHELKAKKGYMNLGGYGIKNLNSVEYLKHISELNLSRNNIEEISKLSALHQLKDLNISNNRISGIEAITSLENLEVLDATNNKIKDISGISKNKKLKWISLGLNKISNIATIYSLPQLEYVYLYGNCGFGRLTIFDRHRYYPLCIYWHIYYGKCIKFLLICLYET